MTDNCICPNPDKRCHEGRSIIDQTEQLCDECVDLWFNIHLKHWIQKIRSGEPESKSIIMRGALQFLNLRAYPGSSASEFELGVPKKGKYWNHRELAIARGDKRTFVTYEVRATNLGGRAFDQDSVDKYRKDHPEEAALLARFLFSTNTSTAHPRRVGRPSPSSPSSSP